MQYTHEAIVAMFDAFEIHGVVSFIDDSDGLENCEQDDDNPEFFGVYGHLRDGGLEWIEDFDTATAAIEYGRNLAAQTSFPLYIFVKH